MKKVIITGKNSYIGEKVKSWISENSDWSIDTVETMHDEWKNVDFSGCDAVFHVAGLAHQKITDENRALYYSVNCDLAVEVAKTVKVAGVKHFVFLSSMSVYSDDTTYIDINTKEKPDNDYGKGKLLAEEKLKELESENFTISLIRPPMVYGKGCKGNYNSLRKLAIKLPVFPKVNNKRSMIFIDNLSAFVYGIINRRLGGVFYPQNSELVNTSDWVSEIAKANGKKVHLSGFMGTILKIMRGFPVIKGYYVKAFADAYYDPKMSNCEGIDYQIVNFRDSIVKTENEEAFRDARGCK